MPAAITCAECRATIKKARGPNAEPTGCDRCGRVKVIPENIVVYNVICEWAPIMWDGESMSAAGIWKSLDWSYVNEEDHPVLARRIMAYFAEVRRQQAQKAKATAAAGKQTKTMGR